MTEWWLGLGQSAEPMPLDVLALRLVMAFVFGCMAAAIYFLTVRAPSRSGAPSFMATLVLLSVLIAMVTMVVGDSGANSVSRAFTLVGALAIVRFRTVVEDTRDTAFVIFAVGVGMAAGAGYYSAPLVAAPLVLVTAWVFRVRPPRPEQAPATLVLRLAAGRPPDESIDKVLRQFLAAHQLTGLSTARGGAALDVTYQVRPRSPQESIQLVTQLNQLEGVQGVELRG